MLGINDSCEMFALDSRQELKLTATARRFPADACWTYQNVTELNTFIRQAYILT